MHHPHEALQRLAVEHLHAVDEGKAAGALCRALALDVLRVADADTAPWWAAVAVLEGGPLRVRRAVDLAAQLVEHVNANDEDSASAL